MTRERMQDELVRIAGASGAAVLFVTHSIAEAIRVGNRILLLTPHPGRAKAEIDCAAGDVRSADGELLSARIERLLFEREGA